MQTKHRMFTTEITMSDAFLEMPKSSQALYFHLNMSADDDGFVGNPKTIMRLVGSSDDDFRILIAKNFVIPFEKKGIIVIKHWRMHNLIRKDRKKDTPYQEEMALLTVKDNGSYTLNGNQLTTKCQPNDNQVTTICPPKIREDKSSKGKNIWVAPTLEQIQEYCKSRNNNVDAKRFFDYYEASGWKDSKGNKVKNWKQKVITWEKSEPKTEGYVSRVENKMSDEVKKILEEEGW